MATADPTSPQGIAPTVDECNDPDHHHDKAHPIPPGGCPDPRQDASAPEPVAMARLNCQIPTPLEERVRKECGDRMIGVGLLVAKALEKFLDELPPALCEPAAVLACDGCGATVDQIRYGGNERAIYPAGWLRLTVTGRPTGEDRSVNLARLDVCSPDCAPAALKAAAEQVAPPPAESTS